MTSKRLKLFAAIAILLGTITWLGIAGLDEGKAYYLTTDEVVERGDEAFDTPIMLMGDLVPGSIRYENGRLGFTLTYNDVALAVVYEGTAPVPDTFRDTEAVQTLVEGRMDRSGHFVGHKIQAKCASKYEADPTEAYRTYRSDS